VPWNASILRVGHEDSVSGVGSGHSEPTVVYVHVGPTRPRWLPLTVRRACLDGFRVIVVVDRPGWERQLPDCVRLIRVRPTTIAPGSFREGFWALSTSRFSALAEAHSIIKEAVLHVESDVRLAPGVPLRILGASVRDVAYPLMAEGRGSGSTVFLRNCEASAFLAESLERHLRDKSGNDMEGLWNFWRENQSTVSLLPGNESADDFRLERSVGSQWVEEHAQIRSRLGGIFDCASYGQFLFGTDGRNNRYGWRKSGTVSGEHFAQPSPARILMPAGWPLRFGDGEALLSLHVHSKSPRVLTDESPQRLIRRPLGQERRQLDSWALRSNVAEAAKRRLRRLKARVG
jgi:hypothetical protein